MHRAMLHAAFVLALVTAAHAQGDTPGTEPASERAGISETATGSPAATIPKLTADHTKFDVLNGPFETGSDVTKACLSCHTEAGKQVSQSLHWTWETINPTTGQTLGKKTVLNSFCGNLATNEPRCSSCHAGYGWEETASFDFNDETKIDCLVCHDTTGEYVKWPTEAGHPLYEPRTQASRMVPYAMG